MRLPWRVSTVSIQKRLSLSIAPRTAGRDAHHGARRASKRAPGAGGLRGAVGEITRVPERRDKRTRLVHDLGGRREVPLTPNNGCREEIEDRKENGIDVLLASTDAC